MCSAERQPVTGWRTWWMPWPRSFRPATWCRHRERRCRPDRDWSLSGSDEKLIREEIMKPVALIRRGMLTRRGMLGGMTAAAMLPVIHAQAQPPAAQPAGDTGRSPAPDLRRIDVHAMQNPLLGICGTALAASLLATALTLQFSAFAAADELKVTLLGTGSPVPSPNRLSQSTLVEAGSQKLVFDMGRGV